MEIVSDAKILRIEPATNGVIIYSGHKAGMMEEKHVFTNMSDLFSFIERNFVGVKLGIKERLQKGDFFETKASKDINDDDKAAQQCINPYAVEGEVYGGGS